MERWLDANDVRYSPRVQFKGKTGFEHRLDSGGAPHRNPDGEEISSPHLHLYRENYGDKWAYPIPVERFPRVEDVIGTLEDFMVFCNITRRPNIIPELFT